MEPSEAVDLGSLLGEGGLGTIAVIAAWRLASAVKAFVSTFETAVKQWRDDAKAQRAHFKSEEDLLSELRDERKHWEAAQNAEAAMRRGMMQIEAKLDALDARVDRAIEQRAEGRA